MTSIELDKYTDDAYKIFQLMEWKWWNGTPTREDIKYTIKDLVTHCNNFDTWTAATGHIQVDRSEDGYITVGVTL